MTLRAPQASSSLAWWAENDTPTVATHGKSWSCRRIRSASLAPSTSTAAWVLLIWSAAPGSSPQRFSGLTKPTARPDVIHLSRTLAEDRPPGCADDVPVPVDVGEGDPHAEEGVGVVASPADAEAPEQRTVSVDAHARQEAPGLVAVGQPEELSVVVLCFSGGEVGAGHDAASFPPDGGEPCEVRCERPEVGGLGELRLAEHVHPRADLDVAGLGAGGFVGQQLQPGQRPGKGVG